MYRLVAFFKFLLKSKNQHGLHSPFIYKLATKCFYNPKPFNEYKKIKDFREKLRFDKNIIEVATYGSGSKVFSSNQRPIHKIASIAGITYKRAKLLFRLVQYFKPNHILELGTSLGQATIAMHLGNPEAKIVSLEGCKNTQNVAKKYFRRQFPKEGFNTVNFINSEFEDYIKKRELSFLKSTSDSWNLIYFDGNHSKEATLNYFHLLLPTANSRSIWIFDDIYWSRGMQEAWQNIKSNPKVTVSIDTYQWGIVFFRQEQKKEDFTIRV